MKSITPDSLIVEPERYGIVICHLVMTTVKGGVEASDLGQRRKFRKQ